MRTSTQFSIGLLFLIVYIATLTNADGETGLKVGFYNKTCPSAESIVRTTVLKAINENPAIAPGIIRMYFHDCFVRGCDGSILIDSTTGNQAEKESSANQGIQGYEVIDKAKQAIESMCRKIVSCSDILAFAARDSAFQAGNIQWQVPAGRRDGTVSKIEDTMVLPGPALNVERLTEAFAKKGLTQEDMVTLSGAHSIGVASCSFFINRLYNFNKTGVADPTLDPQLVQQLRLKCPQSQIVSRVSVPFDPITPTTLDNQYYIQLLRNRGLLRSDQTLITNPATRNMVGANAMFPLEWRKKFGEAMVKLGALDTLTGSQGEIRKNCRVVW